MVPRNPNHTYAIVIRQRDRSVTAARREPFSRDFYQAFTRRVQSFQRAALSAVWDHWAGP